VQQGALMEIFSLEWWYLLFVLIALAGISILTVDRYLRTLPEGTESFIYIKLIVSMIIAKMAGSCSMVIAVIFAGLWFLAKT
jgi:hypothetical protein